MNRHRPAGQLVEQYAGSGWTAIFSAIPVGKHAVVMRISDYIGGAGNKPAIGGYLGADGIVSEVFEAINIKGERGIIGKQGRHGEDGPPGEDGEPGPAGKTIYPWSSKLQ